MSLVKWESERYREKVSIPVPVYLAVFFRSHFVYNQLQQFQMFRFNLNEMESIFINNNPLAFKSVAQIHFFILSNHVCQCVESTCGIEVENFQAVKLVKWLLLLYKNKRVRKMWERKHEINIKQTSHFNRIMFVSDVQVFHRLDFTTVYLLFVRLFVFYHSNISNSMMCTIYTLVYLLFIL